LAEEKFYSGFAPGQIKGNAAEVNREEILSKLEENREIIRSFGVLRLGIFGSYARGEQQKASDMDFLVEFEDATLQRYLDLKEFLEQLFHCPVDLVFMDTLKPRLKPIILNEVVYAEGL
jgi:predicted nucleotidyltransferase